MGQWGGGVAFAPDKKNSDVLITNGKSDKVIRSARNHRNMLLGFRFNFSLCFILKKRKWALEIAISILACFQISPFQILNHLTDIRQTGNELREFGGR